jgi:hypothetical protein
VVTSKYELAMPPKVEFAQAKGFSLFTLRDPQWARRMKSSSLPKRTCASARPEVCGAQHRTADSTPQRCPIRLVGFFTGQSKTPRGDFDGIGQLWSIHRSHAKGGLCGTNGLCDFSSRRSLHARATSAGDGRVPRPIFATPKKTPASQPAARIFLKRYRTAAEDPRREAAAVCRPVAHQATTASRSALASACSMGALRIR